MNVSWSQPALAAFAVNVRDKGAAGDGVTNDATAINTAITAATTSVTGSVFFPGGTYLINSSVVVKSGVSLRGEGWESIIFQGASSSDSIAVVNEDATNGNDDLDIRDLVIDCNRANRPAATNVGLRLIASDANSCDRVRVQNVWVKNVPYAATQFMNCRNLTIKDVTVENTVRDGITVWFNSRNVNISGITAINVRDDCIALNSEADGHVGSQIRNVTISGANLCQASDSTLGSGLRIAGAEEVTVNGVNVEYAQGWGCLVEGGYISTTGLPSKGVIITALNIKKAGTATSLCGGVATTSAVEDVTFSGLRVKDSYANSVQLAGRATVTGFHIRGGIAATSNGISITATGCKIGNGIIEATPSSGISIGADRANVSGVELIGCCVNQGGGGYVLVVANINRAVINALTLYRVNTGSYGVRIATGTSTGVNVKGCISQGFTATQGFSSDGSGTNDITGNLET